MEKAGLRFVRVFHEPWPDRIEGEEHGDVEYALALDEWEADPTRGADARAVAHEGLMARPEGSGRALATFRVPIEGRDEWVAAARHLA